MKRLKSMNFDDFFGDFRALKQYGYELEAYFLPEEDDGVAH